MVALAIGALSSAAIADKTIVSAVATARAEPHEWVLSSEQVQVLDAWLKEHRKVWRANLATPPVPAFSILIKQSDGIRRRIAFFDQPGWSSAVMADGRVASLPATEIASLRQKLGERKGE